jgi:hypothetical protein
MSASAPTVYSERLGQELKLGKLPASEPPSGTIKYAEDVRPALERAGLLPPIPAMFGHGHDFPQGDWHMFGNGPLQGDEGELEETWSAAAAGCGDCTCAGPAHEEMEAAHDAGRPALKISAKTVIEVYKELTLAANGVAYNPENGEGDTGLDIQQVNQFRVDIGFPDDQGVHYKMLAPWAIEPGNIQHIWENAWLIERVGIGLVICEAQMEQFDQSAQPTWEYVHGSPEVGGHYVPIVGKKGLISWAEDVYYGVPFIVNQCDEAWAGPDPEVFTTATGIDAEGYDFADVEKFAVELAKAKMTALGLR